MDKRLFLFIALSLSILLLWSTFIAKVRPPETKTVISKTTTSPTAVPTQPIVTQSVTQNSPASLLSVPCAKSELIFNEAQGTIQEVIFKAYKTSNKLNLKNGLAIGEFIFQKTTSPAQAAAFVYSDPEKKITKHFLCPNSNYTIELELQIQNLSSLPISINLPLVLGTLNFASEPNEARFQDVTVSTADKVLHPNSRKESVFEGVKFLALRNRYFCAIIEPQEKNNYAAWIKKISPQEFTVGLTLPEIQIAAGEESRQKFRIYLGPQDLRLVNQAQPEWAAVIYYGTFDIISHLLLQLLHFIYRLIPNWGLTIVILSILVYLLLYPFTLKQMRSMKKMQVIQPQVEELRKLYKDNPQRLNKEIMELYRQHKVNPLGGCLLLILQMPVFIALYQLLSRSVALKGARFLWIKDLSESDRLFILPTSLPILGNEVNILPIIMAIGMFVQQKISMPAGDSSSAEQQRMMMFLMPVMFGLIFYRMPSGLVLYWLINSLLMLIYQLRLNRRVKNA